MTSSRTGSRSETVSGSWSMATSLRLSQEFTELPPRPQQQPGDGLLAAGHLGGDLGHRRAHQVAADDDVAVVVRQAVERRGQAQQLLLALGLLGRRGAWRAEV